MNKTVIRILTVLNYLQTVPVFLLIPFILAGGYGPYVSSPHDIYGVIDYTEIIGMLLLLAAFPTIYLASRTFIGDVKSVKYRITPFVVILLVFTIVDCVVTFLLCGKEAFLIFSFTSLLMFIWFNVGKNLISLLSETKIYYIAAPAWVIAIPFVLFILFGLVIIKLPEKYNNLVLVDFIICGLMLIRVVTFKSYQVIEENKQLRFTSKLGSVRTVNFSQIKCVRKSKFYYIIEYKNSFCKVLKVSANIKKFKNTLMNNNIEII